MCIIYIHIIFCCGPHDTRHKVVDDSVINYEAISSLLEYITFNFEEGAILVFLPGLAEITKMLEALAGNPLFNDKAGLHSK